MCCNLADIMPSSENEALAILVPTSPEPYRGDGRRMDWLTGIPFVRQQASGGSTCVLRCSSFPTLGRAREPAISVRARKSDESEGMG